MSKKIIIQDLVSETGEIGKVTVIGDDTPGPTPTGTISITENGTYDVAEFAEAVVEVGSDPYEVARQLVAGTLIEYNDPILQNIRNSAFRDNNLLKKLIVPNVTHLGGDFINMANNLSVVAFPKVESYDAYAFRFSKASVIDFGSAFHAAIMNHMFDSSSATILIFRQNGIVPLVNIEVSMPPAFLRNGVGGTIYIPKALYDHLGDGTEYDYKSATNWSLLDGYGKTAWAQIEGSIYENAYADGTPIE